MGLDKTISEVFQHQINIKTPKYWIDKICKYRKSFKMLGFKVLSRKQLEEMNIDDLKKYYDKLVAESIKSFFVKCDEWNGTTR